MDRQNPHLSCLLDRKGSVMAQLDLNRSFASLHRCPSEKHLLFSCVLAVALAAPLLVLHSPPGVAQATQQRGFEQIAPAAQSNLDSGNYYALVIGINDYHAPIPALKTAVHDAYAVADILSSEYGFKVTTLYDHDATRDNILDAIAHFRKSLAENDSFLIYYAGHGSYDREADKGYWLPIDADPDPLVTSRNISADDLTTQVRSLAARHVIIISDSCFSGDLSREGNAISPSDGNQAYIQRMLGAPSRTLLASGSDEPVSDSGSQGHSVFAALLLQAMQSGSEQTFTAEDLFVSIRKSVLARSGQSPQYAPLRNTVRTTAGLDNGDFVFIRRSSAAPPASDIRANPEAAANLESKPFPNPTAAPPYSSTDGRFTVQFPAGQVKQSTQPLRLQGRDSSTLYVTYVEVEQQDSTVAYMVMYNDYPAKYVKTTPQEFLRQVRDAGVKGKTLLSDMPIDLNGVPGREFASSNDQWNFNERLFLQGNRLYQLIVTSAKDKTAAQATQFLDSFKIQ